MLTHAQTVCTRLSFSLTKENLGSRLPQVVQRCVVIRAKIDWVEKDGLQYSRVIVNRSWLPCLRQMGTPVVSEILTGARESGNVHDRNVIALSSNSILMKHYSAKHSAHSAIFCGVQYYACMTAMASPLVAVVQWHVITGHGFTVLVCNVE